MQFGAQCSSSENIGDILALFHELLLQQQKTLQLAKAIMTVTADIQAAVAKVQADVAALLAAQQPPADSVSKADAEALVAQIDALDAQVVAATPAPAPAA